jgi:hypothetical protein
VTKPDFWRDPNVGCGAAAILIVLVASAVVFGFCGK